MWMMLCTGAILGLLLYFAMDKILSRGFPLVVTRGGITAGPYINELWEDIESYRLLEIKGLTRATLSKIGTGTTLLLRNKGLWQRNIGKGGSIFQLQGYFFDEHQKAYIESIFSEYGIRKN